MHVRIPEEFESILQCFDRNRPNRNIPSWHVPIHDAGMGFAVSEPNNAMRAIAQEHNAQRRGDYPGSVAAINRMRGASVTATSSVVQLLPPSMSDGEFCFLAELAESRIGLKMVASKKTMVAARLGRRLRQLELTSISEYCEYLRSAIGFANEYPFFADLMTTHKTDFFREPEHFSLLTSKVLPELLRDRRLGHPLRVWSAGCSTGEEPYTIAMVLDDYLDGNGLVGYSILGTDVSELAIGTAARAVYHASAVSAVPPAFRTLYLLRNRNATIEEVRIAPALRAKVELDVLNFIAPDWGERELCDVIFCRNVLIYFDREKQAAIVSRLCDQLRPGGFLFLGHSESYTGPTDRVRCLPRSVFQRT